MEKNKLLDFDKSLKITETETKLWMDEVMREEATITAGVLEHHSYPNVNEAQVKTRQREKVAGATGPACEHDHEGNGSYELTGLAAVGNSWLH